MDWGLKVYSQGVVYFRQCIRIRFGTIGLGGKMKTDTEVYVAFVDHPQGPRISRRSQPFFGVGFTGIGRDREAMIGGYTFYYSEGDFRGYTRFHNRITNAGRYMVENGRTEIKDPFIGRSHFVQSKDRAVQGFHAVNKRTDNVFFYDLCAFGLRYGVACAPFVAKEHVIIAEPNAFIVLIEKHSAQRSPVGIEDVLDDNAAGQRRESYTTP